VVAGVEKGSGSKRRNSAAKPDASDTASRSASAGASRGGRTARPRGAADIAQAGVAGSASVTRASSTTPLTIRLLGALTLHRGDTVLALPASRKVRALFGYLALAPRPVTRSQLCELLWDVPNDPRGELRWSLSKLRGVLDDDERSRVVTDGDTVALDLSDCTVDALSIEAAMRSRIETHSPAALRDLANLFGGEFLDGIDIDRQPAFDAWLVAQRRRFRACQAAILEHLVRTAAPADETVYDALDKWLMLTPLDVNAHRAMLAALARHGRTREGEEHLATTTRLFETEGLDVAPIRIAWRDARARRVSDASNAAPVAAEPARIVIPSTNPLARESPARRASIAVMPFVDRSGGGNVRGGLAEGLVHDVITRLAKLRVMFVIAHGSVFALNDRNIGPEEAGRMLNVDYVASGWIQRRNDRLILTGELMETRSAHIIWTDNFDYPARDALTALDELGDSIVAAIAHEVEVAERNRAILKAPNSLDAWEAYHRGLWHMYRFNAADNDHAAQFFRTAVELDPTFSRAYAGLSFTHFQNAFLHRLAHKSSEVDRAYEMAGQALLVDDKDPAAHWAMGRALWLGGHHDDAVVELERTVELSPNFALGHYTLSFVHCQSGDPSVAIRTSDHSRELSPFDPLLFAMLACRAIGHLRLGDLDAASEWSLKAVARPNAHRHILAIAAHCLAAAGRTDEARAFVERIRRTNPRYRIDEFFKVFQFAPDAVALLQQGAKALH
jgi:DNA-binding SARP family transcriptional activator/tetratricopeptide (TPR) repeat protein